MSKTSNVFARVEPSVKNQAEAVLNQLGIPMSMAINMYLRQIVLQNGIPFSMKLTSKPIDFNSLSNDEFDNEIQKGLNNLAEGKILSAQEVAKSFNSEYGI